LLSVSLGEITPLPQEAFYPDTWLEMEINGGVLSRVAMVSVPYAFKAEVAWHAENSDALGGLDPTGWQQRVTGSCPPGSSEQLRSSHRETRPDNPPSFRAHRVSNVRGHRHSLW